MNRGQLKLTIIVSIFILPFIISYLMLDDYSPGKDYATTNYGDLIIPMVNISDVNIIVDNKTLPNGKWLLLYYSNTKCDKECFESIYLMRQVNTALGKDMDRLKRIFLSNNLLSNSVKTNLLENYPDLLIIKNKPNKIHVLIKEVSNNKNAVLLIDPLGNVILRYDNNFDGKKLLKDIKKLFKLSRVG
ncbi:MAG: hypothetical protein HOI56_02855 [Gammaproteobacteria bacterium]|jgi:cytochrome oxidase Cu insertion factor (SCO1/SenC/PrrC family)|nr:hypothetical protein [Gammaproteobacteria bacterium]MBT4462540.1 hypothetical protein [Gammaproteobacteria bacterium]MBT4654787.1 hypothetical protein [Gammaproteobacteria bacterium]MBT5116828.1 hypothetical protein [Gammaproteobacteria bacterium]MBT5761660.1 hypothetical protein [Gammaproteobacteria bacterium]